MSSVCLIILFVACSVRESWPPKTTGPNLPVRYWLRVDDGGDGYWKELLNRIRDIRASEKVFYRQILDIYATSVDYDPVTCS